MTVRGIATVAAIALLATTTLAGAAEVTVLATTAMKSALDALAPQFAAASGHTLRLGYGPSGALVAAGEAEIGLQQISEIMSVDGVDLVGPLPDELQSVTVYSAGVLAKAAQPDAARALIEFLRTPQAAAVFRAKGLEP